VALEPFMPAGARMDVAGTTQIVTIFYRAPTGESIAIGWLDASPSPLAETQAAARTIDGRTVIVLHTPAGNAVIGGDAPVPVLWSAAGTVEAAGSR
jgi:hypothetical protein